MGRNPEAEAVLREGILRAPDEGDLHFSLSLLLAESGKMEAASASLERAAALLPERARVHYNLGLTLQHLNRRSEAEAALLRALVLDSAHPDFIHALAVFYMQGADWGRAEHYARLLFEAVPEDPGARELLQRVLDEVAAQQAAPSER